MHATALSKDKATVRVAGGVRRVGEDYGGKASIAGLLSYFKDSDFYSEMGSR